MEPESAGRRLAAIMFTDLVGSTALIAESEQLGRRLRERHVTTGRCLVARYHGQWSEEKGSVVQASQAAVNTQARSVSSCAPG